MSDHSEDRRASADQVTAPSAVSSLTIDDERTCVRCGAPEWHCMCEPVAPDGHWWVAPSVGANNTEWTVCMKCGNVKRDDGKPSSTCRGPVKVVLRGEVSLGAALCEYCGDRIDEHSPSELRSCAADIEARQVQAVVDQIQRYRDDDALVSNGRWLCEHTHEDGSPAPSTSMTDDGTSQPTVCEDCGTVWVAWTHGFQRLAKPVVVRT